jgi:nucleotide-binding universal stress UspA family protein
LEEQRLQEAELQRAGGEDPWGETYDGGAAGHIGDVRGILPVFLAHQPCLNATIGTGFHTRDLNEQDVDEEVDVDGDDQVFGDPQFTEGDILPVGATHPPVEEDVEVEIEEDGEDEAQRAQRTLRSLVAEGKLVRRTSNDEIASAKAKMEEVMGVGDTEKMDLAILGARKRGDKPSLIIALENKVKQLVSPCWRGTTCPSE